MLTLRQAIEAANGTLALSSLPASQVVAHSLYLFQINLKVSGTIALQAALPSLSGSVVTISGPGEASLTIRGDGQYDTILPIGAGESVSLAGVTIDGNSYQNAGISVTLGGTLTLGNSLIQKTFAGGSNLGGDGGAINSQAATVSVTGCQFASDIADWSGGAIANIGGVLTVTQSTFTGNLAVGWSGGAIYNVGGPGGPGVLNLSDSTLTRRGLVIRRGRLSRQRLAGRDRREHVHGERSLLRRGNRGPR